MEEFIYSMDTAMRALGFANTAEMHSMVAAVDLSTQQARDRFEKWQRRDGTKLGLLAVLGGIDIVDEEDSV